jgi:hypothetical protein
MLVTCPDCSREISDRARTCPGCGFPIAEHLAEVAQQRVLAEDRSAREHVGEVDCAICLARGFRTIPFTEPDGSTSEGFEWCRVCEHTGRVTLCKSPRGYFAVARLHVDAFVAGTRDDGDDFVVFLGTAEPPPHRYPEAGPRVVVDDE